MTKSIRVLIVSNRSLVRAGLRLLIESHDTLTVIGEANSHQPLVPSASERADVLLFYSERDAENFLDLMPELLAGPKPTRVILLADSTDRDFQQRAIQFGASGLVSRDEMPEILFKAIEKVHSGEVWFERSSIANALSEMSRPNGARDVDHDALKIATLSKREREVVGLIGEGLKNKQIAERLFVSDTTIQHHLSSVFAKLGVADRLELVIYAYRHGLVKLPPQLTRKG